MPSRISRLAILILPVSLLSGCAADRVEQIERDSRSGLNDVRNIQASQGQEISRIQEEVRRLSGKVEELQHTAVGKTRNFFAVPMVTIISESPNN